MVLLYDDFSSAPVELPNGPVEELKAIVDKAIKFNISQKGNFNFKNFLYFILSAIRSWQIIHELKNEDKIKLNLIKNLAEKESIVHKFQQYDVHKINTFLKMIQDFLYV